MLVTVGCKKTLAKSCLYTKLVGKAFPRTMTPTNIQSGFRVSGIFPFDRDIFSDEEFMPSNVTDRPMEITETPSTPSSSNQPPVITVDEMPPTSKTLLEIMLHLKVFVLLKRLLQGNERAEYSVAKQEY